MNRTGMIIAGAAAISMAAPVLLGYAAQSAQAQRDEKTLMQKKLQVAQEVLQALALEDFDKIADGAKELHLLSTDSQWAHVMSPTYGDYGAQFRAAAQRVEEMAMKKNLEGATLNYVQLVVTCVECHKTVRHKEGVARAPIALPLQDWGR